MLRRASRARHLAQRFLASPHLAAYPRGRCRRRRDHAIEHPSERLTSRLELEVAEIVGKVADAWERQQEAERREVAERAATPRRTTRRKWVTELT